MQCTLFLLWSMCRHSHLVPRVERTCGRTSECADVQANALVRMVRISTSVVSTMHAQMCTLDRCCEHQRTHCLHARYKMCICAHVCAVCSFTVEEQGWGGFTSLWEHLLLGVGVYCDSRKDKSVVCVFSIFNAGGSVCGCMCVYARTHTHTVQMGYSDVNPGVGMRHLEGPKNPDGLNLGIHIFIYVYKGHMCT